MARTGAILSQETKKGEVINLYGCANRQVARELAIILFPRDKKGGLLDCFTWKIKSHEFLDSEYPDTIGYWRALNDTERRVELHILGD
jgi:hypothetical protein